MEYRIAFTTREPWLAVLQLRQTMAEYASPVASAAVRDVVLNRVLDQDLRSLPLGAVRLVAGDVSGDFEYRLSPNIHDYIARGGRYTTAPEPARGGKTVDLIRIDPRRLVAGSTRVDTLHATADPLSPEVAAALA